MSKIIVLGDLHIGAGKHDEWTAANQQRFFDEDLFPYMEEHGIDTIIQTGDWFDDRNAIKHKSHELTNYILWKSRSMGIQWHVIVGNHDMAMRETVTPNAVTEILDQHDHVWVYDRPETATIKGYEFDMIPWICQENRQEIIDFMATSTRLFAIGHFELKGFRFYPGQTAIYGDDPKILTGYNKVLSGHYHTPSVSDDGSIRYVGTPYTLNMNDAGDERGFWVFDPYSEEFEFVANKYVHHEKFWFDASTVNLDDLDYDNAGWTKLWVVVENPVDKKRRIDFSKVSEKLVQKFADVRVDYQQDLKMVADSEAELDSVDTETKSTDSVISDYVQSLDIEDRREQVQKKMTMLHREAQEQMSAV